MTKINWGIILYNLSIVLMFASNYAVTNGLFYDHLQIDRSNRRQRQLIKRLPFDVPVTAAYILYQFIFFMMLWSFLKSHYTNPGYINRKLVEKDQQLKPPSENQFKEYLKQNKDKKMMKKIVKEFQLENEEEFVPFPDRLIKHCQKCYSSYILNNKVEVLQEKKFKENLPYYFWKPLRAHHCKQCNRCVQQMDHHCLWTNNCVGVKNVKFFLLFNLYTCIFCIYNVIAYSFSIFKKHQQERDQWWMVYVMLVVNLFFLVLCFGYFSDILQNSEQNRSEVEKKQKLYGKPYNLWDNLYKYMGPKISRWLLPIDYSQDERNNYLEILYSYQQIKMQPDLSKAVYLEDNFIQKDSLLHEFYSYYQIQ